MTKGLLIVFTGEGKGKTTAALGMAVRAAGHGLPVCFIQFIKGSWRYGELEAVKRFEGLIDPSGATTISQLGFWPWASPCCGG